MKNLLRLFLSLVVGSLALAACQGATQNIGQPVSVDGGEYRVVSVEELQGMLETKDFTLINVHIPWQGNIPQTDLHLAYDQITAGMPELPRDKDEKILVYCLTSGMARIAAENLVGQGYTNIWMLDGGTSAWEEAGLALNKE